MASNTSMDPDKFRSTMNSLNYGTVMEAAARNLMKEMALDEQKQNKVVHREIDLDDLENDPELEELHRDRMLQMKKEAEKRSKMASAGHGEYRHITEPEFLPEVTGSRLVLCHFYHDGFERCRILDKHLAPLAKKYFGTKFVKIHAPDAPFFVTKLNVKVLPCLVFFCDGKAYDRIVGFDEFGARDDFNTDLLERKLLKAKIVAPPEKDSDDEPDEAEQVRRSVRQSKLPRGKQDSDDEDSDFD